MSTFYYDPDEWETYVERGNGSFTCGMRRRDPMEVALIKSEKRRAHEDAVLAEAELIRSARADR